MLVTVQDVEPLLPSPRCLVSPSVELDLGSVARTPRQEAVRHDRGVNGRQRGAHMCTHSSAQSTDFALVECRTLTKCLGGVAVPNVAALNEAALNVTALNVAGQSSATKAMSLQANLLH